MIKILKIVFGCGLIFSLAGLVCLAFMHHAALGLVSALVVSCFGFLGIEMAK